MHISLISKDLLIFYIEIRKTRSKSTPSFGLCMGFFNFQSKSEDPIVRLCKQSNESGGSQSGMINPRSGPFRYPWGLEKGKEWRRLPIVWRLPLPFRPQKTNLWWSTCTFDTPIPYPLSISLYCNHTAHYIVSIPYRYFFTYFNFARRSCHHSNSLSP